jgi:hypothetical protein
MSQLGVGVSADSPATGRGGPSSSRTDFTWPDLLAWLKFVLSLGLGIALGAENLNAPEASGWLRVPALLAALILCAQGPVDLSEHSRQKEAEIEAERAAEEERRKHAERERAQGEADADADVEDLPGRIRRPWADAPPTVETAATAAATDQLEQQMQLQKAEARVTAGAVANSRAALMTILILAIWLGLATLNYPAAPPLLLWLSLVASFLLFMSVWGGLQKRPA